MPIIKRSVSSQYKSSDLFNLVHDVEAYPEFLPYCQAAIIHTRSEDEISATLRFAKGNISYSWITCNRIQPNKRIDMTLVEGPFRSLEGSWHFEEFEEKTHMHFHLQFEFSNRLLSLTVTPMLQWITDKTIQAFVQRADFLYG